MKSFIFVCFAFSLISLCSGDFPPTQCGDDYYIFTADQFSLLCQLHCSNVSLVYLYGIEGIKNFEDCSLFQIVEGITSFKIYGLPDLLSTSGLNSLSSVHNLYVQNNPLLTKIDFPSLENVGYTFQVSNNSVLVDFEKMPLSYVKYLTVTSNPSIQHLTNLWNSITSSSSITIDNNNQLLDLYGFNIDGSQISLSMVVSNNPKLSSINAIGNTKFQYLQVFQNNVLSDCLNPLCSACGSCNVFSNGPYCSLSYC
jgi:hypothetical protein